MTLLCEVFVKKPSPQQGMFAQELVTFGFVHIDRMIDQLWGRDPDGGPLNARNTLSVFAYKLRKILRPGWRIKAEYDRGFHLFAPEAVTFERVAA